MFVVSDIGLLIKKIHRAYAREILYKLQSKGFNDLRPSFLEILIYICEEDGPSIRQIGESLGLKKQTMTGHMNELEKRGYIVRQTNEHDKREQRVFLTEHGEKFKFLIREAILEAEKNYVNRIGQTELDRLELLLKKYYQCITNID